MKVLRARPSFLVPISYGKQKEEEEPIKIDNGGHYFLIKTKLRFSANVFRKYKEGLTLIDLNFSIDWLS